MILSCAASLGGESWRAHGVVPPELGGAQRTASRILRTTAAAHHGGRIKHLVERMGSARGIELPLQTTRTSLVVSTAKVHGGGASLVEPC
eukprot:5821199-Pleurochrysis_carterae.AAC.3